MEMYKDGQMVAFALFDALGANRSSWLAVNRLIDSTWNDVQSYAAMEATTFSTSGRCLITLQWRHNERDGFSNHQPQDRLLNRLFKSQIKENIKALRHWPLWGEFTGDRWIPSTMDQ